MARRRGTQPPSTISPQAALVILESVLEGGKSLGDSPSKDDFDRWAATANDAVTEALGESNAAAAFYRECHEAQGGSRIQEYDSGPIVIPPQVRAQHLRRALGILEEAMKLQRLKAGV